MSIRTTWSGGATWSGTAKWMPDGSPTGPFPTLHAAVDGTLMEPLVSAEWGMGPGDWLAGLSPSSATFTFEGAQSILPRQQIVLTCPVGALWVGYVDTVTATRDEAGNWTTSVMATDPLARLGSASELSVFSPTDGTTIAELGVEGAAAAGTVLTIIDGSKTGLPDLDSTEAQYKGSVVDFINRGLKSSNAMAAWQRDGTIRVIMREGGPGSDINGDFEVDTSGWAAYSGGSIARSTSTPLTGVAEGRVTCTTTQYSGAAYAITGTFKAGRTYRLSMLTELISGENAWYIQCFGSYDSPPFTSFTATGTPTVQTVDFTPDVDVTDMELYVGAIDAVPVAGVLAIDDVTIREATVDVSDRHASWTTVTTVETDINVWWRSDETTIGDDIADLDDYFERGARYYVEDPDIVRTNQAGTVYIYDDWIAYGGQLRETAVAELVAASWDDEDLVTLDPFDWLMEDGTAWQVLNLRHSVSISPPSWRVTVTLDNLLDLL